MVVFVAYLVRQMKTSKDTRVQRLAVRSVVATLMVSFAADVACAGALIGGPTHHGASPAQQPRSCCMGGHFTEPKEQKTQQSPGFGRNTVLQFSHS